MPSTTSASSAEVDRSTALARRRVLACRLDRTRHGVAGGHERPGSGQRVAVDLAAEQVAQLGRVGERVDHRQRVHALEDVVAGRLAEHVLARGHVEHVVDDLEAHAEVVAEGGECLEGRIVDRRDHAADATRRREERGGLARDRVDVRVDGPVGVEEVLQLEHLPAAQLADGGREQGGDVGAERRGERRRPGEQVVAGEDGHDVRPAGVHARDAPPGLGLVDHVVVVQRTEVHQLHRHPAGDGVVGDRPEALGGVGGADREGRAQPLAAGGDEVAGDVREERVLGADRAAEGGLDPLHVGRHRREAEGVER